MSTDVQQPADPFAASAAIMQQMAVDNAAFQATVQGVSAQIQSNATATNMITSAHSSSANNAKNVGQGMVESSRK